MTFLDVLVLIASREEKVIKDSIYEMLTEEHRYVRRNGEWFEESNGTEDQASANS